MKTIFIYLMYTSSPENVNILHVNVEIARVTYFKFQKKMYYISDNKIYHVTICIKNIFALIWIVWFQKRLENNKKTLIIVSFVKE